MYLLFIRFLFILSVKEESCSGKSAFTVKPSYILHNCFYKSLFHKCCWIYYSFTFFVLLQISKIEKVNNKHSIEIFFYTALDSLYFFIFSVVTNKLISSISLFNTDTHSLMKRSLSCSGFLCLFPVDEHKPFNPVVESNQIIRLLLLEWLITAWSVNGNMNSNWWHDVYIFSDYENLQHLEKAQQHEETWSSR